MAKIIISPCLFLKDGDLKNLGDLENTLDFINKYLNIEWDMINLSALDEDNWANLPTNKPQLYNYFFKSITTLLRNVNKRKIKYCVPNDNVNFVIDESFYISDNNELLHIVKYIRDTNDKIIVFVGHDNYNIPDILNIEINNVPYNLPVVKDPWLDKSGNFDKYIIPQHYDRYFTNGILCTQLDKEMQSQADKSSENQTLYKDYGKIIAYRNGFIDYDVKDPYDEDTDYYKNKKCSISVDILHGHFEVFQNGGKELWIHQYNFSGDEIPYSQEKTLKEMQNSHSVHKRHHN